ncbi:MT-A70 family methyltransferase, partial [Flavobacterium filum]|uniref:MT-A70 family methyltransferase n=1 Tax=Flavobacterium filum TaxID=370974 RepID=UPI0023EF90F8
MIGKSSIEVQNGNFAKPMLPAVVGSSKKYSVIYADPAWDVKKIKRNVRPNQVEFDYPTMKLEDIKALPVKNITDDNCVLFLWTTHAYLPKAFEVMTAWGFKYQRTITWDKK